jgi:hypothetical protein
MNVNESLWSVKLPNGDVRTGTFEQLDEAFRAHHLAESVLVRAAGSASWVKLGDLMGSAPAHAPMPAQVATAWQSPPRVAAAVPEPTVPSAAPRATVGQRQASVFPPPAAPQPQEPGSARDHDVWQVKLPNGEVRSGTRQQLVEAFHAGHLGEGALVLASGAREWVTLGSFMGRGQPVSAWVAPPAPAPAPAAPQPESAPPLPAPSVPPVLSTLHTSDRWTEGDREVWQVKLTRPQLELGLRDGYLDEDAPVLATGASEWVRLGSVVGRVQPVYAPEAPTEPSAATDGEVTPVPAPSSDSAATPPSAPVSSPSPVPETQSAQPEPSHGDHEPASGEMRTPGREAIEQTFQSERFGE